MSHFARSLALLFALSLPITGKAQADTRPRLEKKVLSTASYLRKLSFHLRGHAPLASEYEELAVAQVTSHEREFFDKKILEYLSAPEHLRKMSFRLEELFQLETSPREAGAKPLDIPYQERNALNELFHRMTKENLPWDALLKGKSYQAYPLYRTANQEESSISDWSFLHALAPELLPPMGQDRFAKALGPLKPIPVTFAEDDPRVAGALSTARFFRRYTTTALNKNRRRAAAVFNVFLCDPMQAAVPPPIDPGHLLDKAFPKTSDLSESDIRRVIESGDAHGADKACAKCHYKLDPLGQAFVASNVGLSPKPTSGALVYHDKKTGKLVNQSVSGLGELGEAIAKQPVYVDCQVNRFWTWFIGADRVLTDTRRKELTLEFERVGRRTNDFIAVLLKSPEFGSWEPKSPAQAEADAVKAVFRNCTSCHAPKYPDLTEWPIGGTKLSMKRWVGKISDALDLAGDGSAREMPPKEFRNQWDPTAAQLELIKTWIEKGAPDEQGVPQI